MTHLIVLMVNEEEKKDEQRMNIAQMELAYVIYELHKPEEEWFV